MPHRSTSLLSLLARSVLLCPSNAGAFFAACAKPAVLSLAAGRGAWDGAARALASRSFATVKSPSSALCSFSTSSSSTSSSSNDKETHLHLGDASGRAHTNALLYRARQRGFLELDLLLGGWATRHASSLDAEGRAALEELLELENPDLFAWLTGQVPAPPEVASNAAFQSIAADVAERLHRHRPNEAKSKDGAKWVRGWDDIKKEGGK